MMDDETNVLSRVAAAAAAGRTGDYIADGAAVAGSPATEYPAATEAARAEAYREGGAQGVIDERQRMLGILDHPNAKGREKLSRKLAFSTSMSIEEAGAFMGDLPIDAVASKPDPYANAGTAPMRNTPSACKIDLRQIYADRASQATPVKH